MNAVFWGALSALSFGTADFMARFSTRAAGARAVFLFVLAIGGAALTAWIALAGLPLPASPRGLWLAAIHGVAALAMTLLLYTGLARGPVSVVAPIVAAHPVLVLLFALALGARPSIVQWIAMAAILLGVALIARTAEASAGGTADDRTERRATLLIAFGASLAYAMAIVAGQAAAPLLGEVQTTWFGRVTGLVLLAASFALARERPRLPLSWLPFVALQGVLDTAGYLALLAGGRGASPEIAVVVASTFGVITVLLARVFLREAIGFLQWAAMALVFAGVAVLAGH